MFKTENQRQRNSNLFVFCLFIFLIIFIVKSYLNERFEVGGNLQPVLFDGGDYQRGPEAYLNPPKPKVYRGDHGPESDYDNPKPLYIPKQILVHLDLKGAPPKIDFLLKFIQVQKNLFNLWEYFIP